MEKLSKHQLEQIVRRQMPKFEVVESVAIEADRPLSPQMKSPGLAAIQEKLRQTVEPYIVPEEVVVTDSEDHDVVQSVRVRPVDRSAPQEEKTVLISATTKSIIGAQG